MISEVKDVGYAQPAHFEHGTLMFSLLCLCLIQLKHTLR